MLAAAEQPQVTHVCSHSRYVPSCLSSLVRTHHHPSDPFSPRQNRSNYRICRVMVRRPIPLKAPTLRPEVCYDPLPLTDMAACVVVSAKRPLPQSLPADIEALLNGARERLADAMLSCRWNVKDRSCADVKDLRIGNFADYPGTPFTS